jgi:3',5'-cyclic AMP phosphodiesterase CpdA
MTNRRDFFHLAGGAIWLASCARGGVRAPDRTTDGFLVVQITDTHWGYTGPANPQPRATIEHAIEEIANWPTKPDLVIHTGDVTQLTADARQRVTRLREAQRAFAQLGVPMHYLPGEHDASLDAGAAFREVLGPTRWSIEHRGVHLIGLDNVSDPKGALGDAQLGWFEDELRKLPKDARLVVFVHRPLFALARPWDWFTADGDRALALLERRPGTTVFYGHIHQANLARTGATTHVAARGLVFPLPAPGSVPEKAPLPWDAAALDHGLGYRGIAVERSTPVWIDRALV